MRNPIALSLWTITFFCTPVALVACDGDEEQSAEDTGPIVGVMELPISFRNQAPAPSNAVHVEISPTELRLEGHKVIDLERGLVPRAERGGDVVTKLQQAISSGPARRAAALRLHVNTPYLTTALVLSTLRAANISQVGFEVRPPGGLSDTGWLVLDRYAVEPASQEPHEFERPFQRQWDELVEKWADVYTACRSAHYVDCNGAPFNPARGGSMEIRLFARGSALKVEFIRFGIEDPEPGEGGPPMLEGVPVQPTAEGEEALEMGPPVTEGAFTWRFAGATEDPSPISAAFRPLCGARPCGIVNTGDSNTMTLRPVSFIGAAFPDGTEAPYVVFRIPTR